MMVEWVNVQRLGVMMEHIGRFASSLRNPYKDTCASEAAAGNLSIVNVRDVYYP